MRKNICGKTPHEEIVSEGFSVNSLMNSEYLATIVSEASRLTSSLTEQLLDQTNLLSLDLKFRKSYDTALERKDKIPELLGSKVLVVTSMKMKRWKLSSV
jgi:hypothetical protein